MKKLVMGVFAFMNRLFGYGRPTFATVDSDAFEQGVRQDGVQLVDVRTDSEFRDGTIEGAIHLDYLQSDFVERTTDALDPARPVYVFCRSGHRSANAAKQLARQGFEVVNLAGGFVAWTEAGKPVSLPK